VNAEHAGARAFAWAGAVLFAGALAYFLYSYSLTFGEIGTGEIGRRDIATNVALFSLFALHHSIFARLRVRALVQRTVPAKLERSVYVWVASLMLIGVCYLWRVLPGTLWQIDAPWSWALAGVQLFAVWLTLRSAVVIDAFDLAGVRQVLNPKTQDSKPKSQTVEFKTDGPYGWVRHPIYLGWMLIVFSVGTMTMTRFVFAAVSTVYLLVAIPFEERTIRAQFRGYDEYVRRVPRKLIPGVY